MRTAMDFVTYLGTTFGPLAALAGILALAGWAVFTKAIAPELERRRAIEEKRRQAEHEDRTKLLQVVEKNTVVMGQVTQSHSELAHAITGLRTDLTVNRAETERISRDVEDIRDTVNELKGRRY